MLDWVSVITSYELGDMRRNNPSHISENACIVVAANPLYYYVKGSYTPSQNMQSKSLISHRFAS